MLNLIGITSSGISDQLRDIPYTAYVGAAESFVKPIKYRYPRKQSEISDQY